LTSLPDVLESCRFVVQRACFVRIDHDAIARWADQQTIETLGAPASPPELLFQGDRDESANLTLLLSCLNFCFWSDEPWSVEFRGRTWTRTYAMYAGILRAIEDDDTWLTPQRWRAAGADDIAHLFRGRGGIPLPDRRREVLNETGHRLLERFEGRFAIAAEQVRGDARALAYLLADVFPSFRDAPEYQGRTVAILKRAQICAADLHHSWTRLGYDGLEAMDCLTVFADYRLPQYLRHVGVLTLEPELAATIDARREIRSESDQEIELRCATVVAADLLQTALAERGLPVPAWHLDFVLWERSHDADVSLPHHRTRSVYY